MGADEAGGGAEFVGEDGELGAAGAEGAEDFEGAGEEDDIIEHSGIPIGAVDGEGGGDAGGTDEVGDGVFESATDGGADLREGGRREAELAHRVTVAAVDRGKVIDERAVEVEEDGGEA